MQKKTSKVLQSRTFMIKKESTRKLQQALRATTRGTRLRQSSPKTSPTNVVEQMLEIEIFPLQKGVLNDIISPVGYNSPINIYY